MQKFGTEERYNAIINGQIKLAKLEMRGLLKNKKKNKHNIKRLKKHIKTLEKNKISEA